jgi:hypothetical protein
MNRVLLTTIFSAAMVLGTGNAASAQSPNPQNPNSQSPNPQIPNPQSPRPQQQEQSDDSRPTTVIGCLAKGATPEHYILTENKSGQKLSFTGPNQLDKFLNQTVQLSGTVAAQTFRPESIKPVSPTCDSAPAK